MLSHQRVVKAPECLRLRLIDDSHEVGGAVGLAEITRIEAREGVLFVRHFYLIPLQYN